MGRSQRLPPIALDVIARIAGIYRIEAEARGQGVDERRALRQAQSKPLMDGIKAEDRAAMLPPMGNELLAKSLQVVPELVEMLHVTLAGSRNIEIR